MTIIPPSPPSSSPSLFLLLPPPPSSSPSLLPLPFTKGFLCEVLLCFECKTRSTNLVVFVSSGLVYLLVAWFIKLFYWIGLVRGGVFCRFLTWYLKTFHFPLVCIHVSVSPYSHPYTPNTCRSYLQVSLVWIDVVCCKLSSGAAVIVRGKGYM